MDIQPLWDPIWMSVENKHLKSIKENDYGTLDTKENGQ